MFLPDNKLRILCRMHSILFYASITDMAMQITLNVITVHLSWKINTMLQGNTNVHACLPPHTQVSQEECSRLQEGVLYVKVCWYNPKHLCPNLNGYGDNGQKKCDLQVIPCTVPVSWQVLSKFVLECGVQWWLTLSCKLRTCFLQSTSCCAVSHVMSVLAIHVCCIVPGTLRTTMAWRASFFISL
jgi:hypothetical protein